MRSFREPGAHVADQVAALLVRQKHLDQLLESAKPKLRIVADGTEEDLDHGLGACGRDFLSEASFLEHARKPANAHCVRLGDPGGHDGVRERPAHVPGA
jgi:hypothetical protein